jgi:hypothetical protein
LERKGNGKNKVIKEMGVVVGRLACLWMVVWSLQNGVAVVARWHSGVFTFFKSNQGECCAGNLAKLAKVNEYISWQLVGGSRSSVRNHNTNCL